MPASPNAPHQTGPHQTGPHQTGPNQTGLHPLHRLWRRFPPEGRRLLLARLGARLAPKPDRRPPEHCRGVIVGGEVGRASGLGEAARIMHRALDRIGVPTAALQAGLDVPGEKAPGSASAPVAPDLPDGLALLLHVNAPVLPAALLRLPRGLVRGRRVIGYWAWELQSVPPSWRPAASCVHEVWAPSAFTAAALETLLPGRVRVVPIPLALSPPAPAPLGRAAFGLPEAALVVLVSFSVASAFERKNPLAAIVAFRKAFGDRPDRILLIKAGHAGHYPGDMDRLREAIDGCDNIRIETRMLAEADMHALTRSADIVLSLHRSEGFGLVPAQAMLLGRAVVATDWSATAEFLDESCGVPVACRLVEARDPRGVFQAPGAVWADADTDAAAQALRRLADAPEWRKALGERARLVAGERFGAEGLRRALAAIGYAGPQLSGPQLSEPQLSGYQHSGPGSD
ncbi:glycosyltransferase family 4 protein [Lichenicoccus sp.]|uniref:glycosyltransferase family 4 protein n=1 Tax=Lichenicoccus sp. TaxID=2781899 RepID=UPI003D14EBB2